MAKPGRSGKLQWSRGKQNCIRAEPTDFADIFLDVGRSPLPHPTSGRNWGPRGRPPPGVPFHFCRISRPWVPHRRWVAPTRRPKQRANQKIDSPSAQRCITQCYHRNSTMRPCGVLTVAHGDVKLGRRHVSILMVRCPNTGQEIATGFEADARSFRQLPSVLAHSRCPACGLEHPWWKREAWLEDDDSTFVPADTAA